MGRVPAPQLGETAPLPVGRRRSWSSGWAHGFHRTHGQKPGETPRRLPPLPLSLCVTGHHPPADGLHEKRFQDSKVSLRVTLFILVIQAALGKDKYRKKTTQKTATSQRRCVHTGSRRHLCDTQRLQGPWPEGGRRQWEQPGAGPELNAAAPPPSRDGGVAHEGPAAPASTATSDISRRWEQEHHRSGTKDARTGVPPSTTDPSRQVSVCVLRGSDLKPPEPRGWI